MSTEDIVDSVEVAAKGEEIEKENSEPTQEQKEKRLAELLSSGRRALTLRDVEKATELLSEASELSVELYGEDHENTFEYHLYYGMATLELAKTESHVLKGPNEREEDNKTVEDEEANGDVEKKTDEDEDNGDSEKEDGEESGEEEDDDSMKLAWEILENARCIATAKIEALEAERSGVSAIEEWNLKLADVLVVLGEHGISDGKCDQAREDLERAVNIQSSVLPPNSRKIAHTCILIGETCASEMKFDEALDYYQKTKNVLKAKYEELESKLKEDVGDEQKADMQDECKELEEMIPLIDEKIEDARASAEQVEKARVEIKTQFAGFTSMISQLPKESEEKETNDISDLVRRPAKRPVETSDAQAEEIKKPKEEEEGTSQV